MLVQKLGIELERRLAQCLVYLVQAEAGLQDGELRQKFILLRIGANIGARQTSLHGIHQLVAVTHSRRLVASQRINRKAAKLNLIQRKQNAGNNQWLVLVLQRSIRAQILVQFRRILQYLLRGLLDVSCLFQHIAGVILVDVLLGERNERFNIRQLLIAFAVINPKGRDDMMLRIARNANGENLLKRRILRNMLCIEIRTVHGVIGHSLHARVDNA